MTRRPGLSLVEVLTALFILALGTIAILTMFPLGALQMATAVRDDRSATAAFGADGYFRTYWKTRVVEPFAVNPNVNEDFFRAFTTPSANVTPPSYVRNLPTALPGQVSYPVFVDPMGFVARSDASRWWVGDGGGTNIPRRSLAEIGTNNVLAQRLCSSMDGLGYSDDGVPSADREIRYNYLWVVQYPDVRDKKTANLTVVVFDRRAHLYAPAGSEQVFTGVSLNPNTTSFTVAGSPDVKPGGWVMDASISPATGPGPKIRHANFYRVAAVTEQGGTTLIELQSPIKTHSDGTNTVYNAGIVVFLRGVSGVFPRQVLSPAD